MSADGLYRAAVSVLDASRGLRAMTHKSARTVRIHPDTLRDLVADPGAPIVGCRLAGLDVLPDPTVDRGVAVLEVDTTHGGGADTVTVPGTVFTSAVVLRATVTL